MYGGEFAGMNQEGMMNRLRGLESEYAGVRGFGRQEMLSTVGRFGESRLYGNEDLLSLGTQATIMGKATGMQGSEVAEIFNQLRLKLNTPVEDLAGRFVQLNELAKDMGLSLKQVTNDIIQLSRDNQKYGFSLEQVMSFYKEFEVELKKGTVSAGQLSEYMKGMAETGTEKAVGIAALIASQDPNKVLANFTGNRAVGQEIAGMMQGASPLEAAQIFRIINNPAADITNDPMLAPIAAKYGLDSGTRKRMNPEIERYLMASAQTFAGDSGDLGSQALVYEKFMSLLGMNLPTNLYDRSLYNRGMQGLGDTSNVISLQQGREIAGTMEASVKENLPKLTMVVERINLRLEAALTNVTDWIYEQRNNKTPSEEIARQLPGQLGAAITPALLELGFSKDTITKQITAAENSVKYLQEIAAGMNTLIGSPLVKSATFGKNIMSNEGKNWVDLSLESALMSTGGAGMMYVLGKRIVEYVSKSNR